MKKIIWLIVFMVMFVSVKPIFAADMMTSSNPSKETMEEVAKGKMVFDKLQAKKIDCKSITDDEYDLLGDYYMDQKVGADHEIMNEMMVKVMGEDGEKLMHIAIAKRLSGCDPKAPIPQKGNMFMSMMGMEDDEEGAETNGMMCQKMKDSCPMMKMMNKETNWMFKGFAYLTFILCWLLLLLGVVALCKYIFRREPTSRK